MRTTASKRQSSLELAQAVRTLLDGIHLGEVDLGELRLLAGQALQGGGVQRRFQELEIPAAPFTSTTAEGDDSAVVRGVTALLGQLAVGTTLLEGELLLVFLKLYQLCDRHPVAIIKEKNGQAVVAEALVDCITDLSSHLSAEQRNTIRT